MVFSWNVIDIIKKLHLCHSRRIPGDVLAFLKLLYVIDSTLFDIVYFHKTLFPKGKIQRQAHRSINFSEVNQAFIIDMFSLQQIKFLLTKVSERDREDNFLINYLKLKFDNHIHKIMSKGLIRGVASSNFSWS
jgi:hypothetical protein